MTQEEKIQELERRIQVLENHSTPSLPGIKYLMYIIWAIMVVVLFLTLVGIIQFYTS